MDGYGTYGGTAGKGLCPGSGAYGRSRQKRKCRKHRTTDLAHRIVGNGELEKYHDVALGEYSLFLTDQIFIAANILSAITARRDTFIAAEKCG